MSTILLLAIEAFAYDITYSFTYPYGAAATAAVKEFTVKRGAIKGGPYTATINCGKPVPDSTGTYSCVEKNLSGMLCASALATAVTGQVSPLSEEACITPPPGGMKVIVTYEAQ